MTFLKINGMTVPVESGGIQESTVENAPQARAYSGKMRARRRAINRVWKVKTTPMAFADGETLRGWLSWLANQWSYDGDLFSSRGLPPQSGSLGYLTKGYASLGNQYQIITAAKFPGTSFSQSYGALITGPAATNLLTANQAIPNTAGISAMTATGGATKGLNASDSMTQPSCVRIVFPSSGGPGTISLSVVTTTAGNIYTFRCWLSSPFSTTATVRLVLKASDGTIVNGPSISLPSSGTWTHASVTMTMPAATTTVTCQIQETPANQGVIIVAESFMLELGSGAQVWTAGASTRAASKVTYGINELGRCTSLTWAAWCGPPPMLSGGDYICFMIKNAVSGDRIEGHISGAGVLSLVAWVGGVSTSLSTASGFSMGTTFSHLAFIVRQNAACEIWLNGIKLSATGSLVMPTMNTFDTLEVGTSGGILPWCAPIDEMFLMPYIASTTLLQMLAAQTVAVAGPPTFTCDGVFCIDAPLACTIHDVQLDHQAMYINGVWQKAAAVLSFSMAEV